MKLSWINKKWVVILLHTVSWLVLFSIPFFLKTTYKTEHHTPRPDDTAMFYFYFLSSFLWISLFYINAYFFVPRYLLSKKKRMFIVLHIITLALIFSVHWLYFELFMTQNAFKATNFFIYNTFPYLFIFASSTMFAMILERDKIIRLSRLKETENLKTELLFLRSQVSPHFMFNVLNNMVALARKKSDLLEPSLIKLSSLMRYMLYETDEQKVALEKEVEYIQSYIDLQCQRFGKNVAVHTSFENISGADEIEPMLLIPFVENAFKHGTGMIENAEINITLKEENSLLQFMISNKFNNTTNQIKDKSSGIGLNNVKRRLNLLYGKNHSLYITDKDGWFTVSLQLNLYNA